MTIEKIIEYVLRTPFNTNRAILTSRLRQVIIDNGGNLDDSENPEVPNKDIIYDGGMES